MKKELEAAFGIKVALANLNNAVPIQCVDYGLCDPADITQEDWQDALSKGTPTAPLFQDTKEKDVWNKLLGGTHDDILVYDRFGKVFSYNNKAFPEQDVANEQGYAAVKQAVLDATKSDTLRCAGKPGVYPANTVPEKPMIVTETRAGMRWQTAAPVGVFALGFIALAASMRRKRNEPEISIV